MSKNILEKSTPTPPAKQIAEGLEDNALKLAKQIAAKWREGWGRLWMPPEGVTTQEILQELGTGAAHLVQLSRATVTFLESQLAETRPDLLEGVQARVAMMPEVSINADGTVTLAEPWPKAPEVEETTE